MVGSLDNAENAKRNFFLTTIYQLHHGSLFLILKESYFC